MRKLVLLTLLIVLVLAPARAFGDFFGGDLPLLTTIVANTAQQLTKLQSIIGNNAETLALIKEINKGLHDAVAIIQTQNTTLNPGILSDLTNVSQVLGAVEDIYGKIPNTASSNVQAKTDISVAESIHLNNEAFRYADRIDPEVEKLKSFIQNASPAGAQKATAQSVGILIHVANQLLRTNAAILKVQSENLALQNRKEKLSSRQFKTKYEEMSSMLKDTKPSYSLPSLSK